MHASDMARRCGAWGLFWRGMCAAVMCSLAPAMAQPSSPSVADMIEAIKARKEMAMLPPASRGPRAPTPSRTDDRPRVADGVTEPMVWSVTGMNDQLTAVLVIDRKVHTVSSAALPRTLGGWNVLRISNEAVLVSRKGVSQRLAVPDSASSPFPFVKALSTSPGVPVPQALVQDAAPQRPDSLTEAGLYSRLPLFSDLGDAR